MTPRRPDNRDELEIRRLERDADRKVRALDRRLRELADEHQRVAKAVEDEYRREHFGRPSDWWPRDGA